MYTGMYYIRLFIYWLGGRPKLGSIFHSPSLHLRLAAMEAMRNVVKDIVTYPIVYSGEGLRMTPVKEAQRGLLFDRMMFCMFCGGRMQPFVADVKECPQGCGRAFPTDDSEGLPILTFEPIGD